MPASHPRRAPADTDRIRNPERTKQRLLEAAFDEFAERGYAGARVSSIAERAGVNKQLISYYFGGKEGLHRELLRRWAATEQQLRAPHASCGMAKKLPHGQFLLCPKGSHMAMYDDQQTYFAGLIGFLRKVEAE